MECKKCGGELQGPDANSVYSCERCGRKYRDPFGAIYADSNKLIKDMYKESGAFFSGAMRELAKLMALPTSLLLVFMLSMLLICCMMAFLMYRLLS